MKLDLEKLKIQFPKELVERLTVRELSERLSLTPNQVRKRLKLLKLKARKAIIIAGISI